MLTVPTTVYIKIRGLPFSTYAPRGGGACAGSSLLYTTIAYYMQKGVGGSESMSTFVRTKWKAPKALDGMMIKRE